MGDIFYVPFIATRSSIYRKIDHRLLKKTQTLGTNKLSAIVFCTGEDENEFKKHLKESGAVIKYELPFIHACAVDVDTSKLEKIARSHLVKYISDDANISSLLNIATQEVGSRIVNRSGFTGKNVGIAILDTGIYPHPDLIKPKNRIIAFKDFVNKKTAAYDDNGHGTFIAGVAAGNGYASAGKYAGVAPQANIIGVKVMNSKGEGNSSDILAGMQWVVDNYRKYNIKVMSLSLGSEATGQINNDPLVVAVGEVWKKGIVVVAAAGNSGPKKGTITTPGVSPTIITVGAVDDKRTIDISDDTIAEFSSRGPVGRWMAKPDLVAPGVNIISTNTDKKYMPNTRVTMLKDYYTKMSGTSVSTPMVSGTIALLLEKHQDYTPDQVKQLLMEKAMSISEERYDQGSGLIDSRAILDLNQ